MTADEARGRAGAVREYLRDAMRHVSVPTPDWGAAGKALRWAATIAMELARDCERERERDGD